MKLDGKIMKSGGPIPEDLDEYKKHLRRLVQIGLFKQMRGDPDAPAPAAIGQANAYLDGKGTKGQEETETNEYAEENRRRTQAKMADIDMESDDPATG